MQGLNSSGQPGYMGPRPPAGDGPHRYHFQLFALDMRLDLPPTAPLDKLVEVLQANTIASCELVGTYEQDTLSDRPIETRSFSEAELHAGRGGLDEDDLDRHAPHDPEGTVRRP